jgi:excisionase family DNA binding protein
MRHMSEQPSKLTVREAAEYLEVTRAKVSRMIRDGEIKCTVDPLDKRLRLINFDELVRLKKRSRKAA